MMKRVATLPGMSSWAVCPEISDTVPLRSVASNVSESRLVPVLTLVLWVSCALIGTIGFVLPYARPLIAKAQPASMQVEMLNVELTSAPLADIAPPKMANSSIAPPPTAQPILQPQLPQPVAVALPSPAVAFAVPVEGPTRIVEASQASYSAARADDNAVTTASAPVVETLIYGQGEGKQPAPEYPLRAQREGQEGVVGILFTVGENGRVISVEVDKPSPWPMLNNSALRTVRREWKFASGTPRTYRIDFRFVLPKERS